MQWQCRIAPSLGSFKYHPNEVWGTIEYVSDIAPAVFFGLYGLPDFYALWRHKGPKAILWAGSDITHFLKGYWLDDGGEIKLSPFGLAKWIQENCISYVENSIEAEALSSVGITSSIVPSFLDDPKAYKVQKIVRKKYYTSVSGDNFELYGWHEIGDWAEMYPDVEFHLYGNEAGYLITADNVFIHGRIPQEQMDEEIRKMTGAIRLTRMDGFSEILAKSILWGQWPVSPYIRYPFIDKTIKDRTGNNHEGRDYYLKVLNQHPWTK